MTSSLTTRLWALRAVVASTLAAVVVGSLGAVALAQASDDTGSQQGRFGGPPGAGGFGGRGGPAGAPGGQGNLGGAPGGTGGFAPPNQGSVPGS